MYRHRFGLLKQTDVDLHLRIDKEDRKVLQRLQFGMRKLLFDRICHDLATLIRNDVRDAQGFFKIERAILRDELTLREISEFIRDVEGKDVQDIGGVNNVT